MTHNKSNIGAIELIIAMILSGTIGVFVSESGQSAFNIVFLRCLFGAIFLGVYAYFRKHLDFKTIKKKDYLLISLGGGALVFNWYFLFESFEYATIGASTIAYHTQPFFVLIIATLFLGERFQIHNLVWVVLAFTGFVMIVNPDGDIDINGSYTKGIIMATVAAILYAIATIIAKQLKHIKPHITVVIQMVLGTILLAPLTPLTSLSDVPLVGNHWYWLAGMGLIHTCIMYVLMYSSYQKLPTLMIAVLSYIYPVAAVIVDYLVYGNQLTPLQLTGMVAILASGFLMNNNINPFSLFQGKSYTSEKI